MSNIKRVGVIQSNYIPWRGYFDFIASVDLFVFYDDVQYTKQDWRNRNKVKTESALKWITVPVKYSLGMRIDEIVIAEGVTPWREVHRNLLESSFSTSPYSRDAMSIWTDAVNSNETMLSSLNIRLICSVCQYLGIKTPMVHSRDYHLEGRRSDRLIELLKKVKATHYLSGPSAKDYLEESKFQEAGIVLEYKTYDYSPYSQPWGAFEGAVSVLDLIANTGLKSAIHLRSNTPNVTAQSC